MENNIVSFKCPTCDTSLLFDPEIGKFLCPACGNQYELEDIKNAGTSDAPSFDWGDYMAGFAEEDLTGTVSYICKYCAAEIVTDATTAATRCPYCDNEVIINEKLEGVLKPNYIIPFKFDKKDIAGMWKELAKKKRLLPKNFINDTVIGKAQGVYVPFWLFNCTAEGKVTYEAIQRRSWYSGGYDYTETKYYYVTVDGSLKFKKIPVDASIKMDDHTMDLLEPYDYSALEEFAPGYLSGFLADRFDDNADACLPRADKRINSAVNTTFESCVTGYNSSHPIGSDISLKETEAKYALLPVYLMSADFNGQTYRYAINGQTGKIVGDFPKSKIRWWTYFAKYIGIAGGILMLLMFLLR